MGTHSRAVLLNPCSHVYGARRHQLVCFCWSIPPAISYMHSAELQRLQGIDQLASFLISLSGSCCWWVLATFDLGRWRFCPIGRVCVLAYIAVLTCHGLRCRVSYIALRGVGEIGQIGGETGEWWCRRRGLSLSGMKGDRHVLTLSNRMQTLHKSADRQMHFQLLI
jgi:hypothetical protein